MRPPFVAECSLDAETLLSALLTLASKKCVQILDSGGWRGTEARFLIAGFDPYEVIEAYGGDVRSLTNEGFTTHTGYDSVLTLLDERLDKYRSQRSTSPTLPVTGACIATFSYELAHRLERLRIPAPLSRAGVTEPDACLAFFNTLVVHDYSLRRTFIVSVDSREKLETTDETLHHAARRAVESEINGETRRGQARQTFTPPPQVTSNFSRAEYIAAVERIKEHIFAGNIYQANLTQRLTVELTPTLRPEEIFLRLRRHHPASFAAYIRRGSDTVISASPERFFRVDVGEPSQSSGRTIEAWPIKGTSPRGTNAEEDGRLRAALLRSEKDRAENIMIVDLLRNDLGRICTYGSVTATEICALQEHTTLFHLVSKVRGELRDRITAGDILRATFPCGSITGAPKIRAMEILSEIESDPRGLSMGAIGYFSFDGAMDFNVAIRTMTVRDNVARFNVGGGVVADSAPDAEYDESLLKARALLSALGVLP
ncbi:MAG: aminodeoxychorismate synthase component I [Pyrinomonadaceae bacterium]